MFKRKYGKNSFLKCRNMNKDQITGNLTYYRDKQVTAQQLIAIFIRGSNSHLILVNQTIFRSPITTMSDQGIHTHITFTKDMLYVLCSKRGTQNNSNLSNSNFQTLISGVYCFSTGYSPTNSPCESCILRVKNVKSAKHQKPQLLKIEVMKKHDIN